MRTRLDAVVKCYDAKINVLGQRHANNINIEIQRIGPRGGHVKCRKYKTSILTVWS